jgi:hypothetical protein
MIVIRDLFNEDNIQEFTKFIECSNYIEYLTFKEGDLSKKKYNILLSINHFRETSSILSLNYSKFFYEYSTFLEKHFYGICNALNLNDDRSCYMYIVKAQNPKLDRASYPKLAEDFMQRIMEIRSELLQFYTNNEYEFSMIDCFNSFTGIDDSYHFINTVNLEPGDNESNATLIECFEHCKGIDSVDDNFFPIIKKEVKAINYIQFWERFLYYIDNYKDSLIRKNEVSVLMNNITGNQDLQNTIKTLDDCTEKTIGINDFKARWSSLITPDVLLKCIEFREDCLIPTTILKKTKKYFADEKSKYFDYTTLRDWIDINKKCIEKFKNKKVSDFILEIDEEDVTNLFKTLQKYEKRYSLIVSKFQL